MGLEVIMKESNVKMYLLLVQFAISLAAIFGSLFFSEIMKFPPCNMCWYQRIFIYPIALIILMGLYLGSKDTNKFVTPFVILGLIFSAYHNLVYYKIIQVIVPCTESSPCTVQQLNYLGFITIPLLSLCAFVALSILNIMTIKMESKKGYL
jgi:disulfide bond formation protein DsbB